MITRRASSLLMLVYSGIAVAALDDVSDMRKNFFQDSNSDRQPATTEFPKYPAIARRDRIEGEATVCFMIDSRGKVSRISVRDYSHKIFKRPAVRAMKKSSFEPLAPGQLLATSKTCRTYRFRLEPVVAGSADD